MYNVIFLIKNNLKSNTNCNFLRYFHRENKKRKNAPIRQKYVIRRFRPDPKLNVLWGRSEWEAGFSYKLYAEPWQCNTVTCSLFSNILNRYVSIDLSTETLYDIDDEGGIDNYLLKRTDEELNSHIGSRLRDYIKEAKKLNKNEKSDKNGHRIILPTIHVIDLVGFDKILRPIPFKKHVYPSKTVPKNSNWITEC